MPFRFSTKITLRITSSNSNTNTKNTAKYYNNSDTIK